MDPQIAGIQSIRESPDDDAPRLAHADWLERNGDSARAEFIRLQCWLSAMPENHPDWDRNWQREQELLAASRGAWSIPFGGVTYTDHDLFDRGFLSFLCVYRPADFVKWADYLTNITPTSRLAIGWTLKGDVQPLIECPELAGITEFWTSDEGGVFPEEELETFLRSPFTQNLTRLDFGSSYWFSRREIQLLADLPVLPRLRHLRFGSVSIGANQLVELLRSPHRRELRGLDVRNHADIDIRALCSYPELRRLTHLDLGKSCQSDVDARHLIECPYLEEIRHLGLQGWDEGRDLFSAAARTALWERFGDRAYIYDSEDMIAPIERIMHRWRLITGRPR